jgi:hypothetical protein
MREDNNNLINNFFLKIFKLNIYTEIKTSILYRIHYFYKNTMPKLQNKKYINIFNIKHSIE